MTSCVSVVRQLVLLLPVLLLVACGGGKPGLGKKCNPDKPAAKACKDEGSVCTLDEAMEDNICQLDVGTTCDSSEEETFCVVGSKCAPFPDPEDETATLDMCAIEPGQPCEAGDLCSDGAECLEAVDGTFVCGLDLGAACELPAESAADEDAVDPCVGEAVCSPFADPDNEGSVVGRCALPRAAACILNEADFCASGLLCAEKTDGTHACFEPVVLRGQVADATDKSPLEGIHVIALNDLSEAVSDVAVTDADGNYELSVPVVRNDDGTPVDDTAFTIRVSGADYQTFPGGIRQAIPILSSEAAIEDGGDDELDPGAWVISGTLANAELIPLADDGLARITISGSVITGDEDMDEVDDDGRGVLVVAHGGQLPAPTAIADLGGHYTIFNVNPGAVTVRGYKAGLQLEPEDVMVANEALEGVDLEPAAAGTSDLTGSISLVSPGDGDATSVVLAVEDTFTEHFARGEVPAGCRTPLDVTGTWTIEGVPAGRYVVLAAFENDGLVRDPDQNIAGTSTVIIEVVAGENLDITEAFKVTGALAVIEPGADLPTAVSAPPTLTWADDSSEAFYSVEVYNALGDLVWDDQMVPSVSGGDTVSVTYGGPMTSGMYYQFRAKSWRAPGGRNPSPISATEDLRGVFFVE